MSSIKVSIIVPVYNVEKYLDKCLNTLINQKLKEIEIICIDDCSTDDSLNILKGFAQKDSRIKIIEQQTNEGQGVARNLGIKAAEGEYIGFIDPDDFVEVDMFEKLYNQAKFLNSEIVIGDYDRWYEQKKIIKKSQYLHTTDANYNKIDIVFPNNINLDKNLIDKILLISPCYSWNNIYNKQFLLNNNIFFSEIRCFEDVMFILKSFLSAKNISYTDKVIYHYRIHATSTLRATNNVDSLVTVINIIREYLTSNNIFDKYEHNFKYFILANAKNRRNKLTKNAIRKLYISLYKNFSNKEQKFLRKRLRLKFIDLCIIAIMRLFTNTNY